MYGYLGELKKAEEIFKGILNEINNTEFLVETYLNIVWVNLSLYRNESNEQNLEEAKKYLDLANKYSDSVSNNKKGKLNINFSVYYFFKNEYEEAIRLLEEAINYLEEKDLPEVYNNLAELHLKFEGEDVSELVKEYTEKAELIGEKYGKTLEVAKSFYTRSMAELRDEDFFTALDTLHLSFEYFINAEAYSFAFDCLMKINEV